MTPDKFEPRTITLFSSKKPRAAAVDELNLYIRDLPEDKVFHVKIKAGEEDRSQLQNRLYQVVIGQVIKQLASRESCDDERELDPEVVAGKMKYTILLPMKGVMAAEHGDDKLMTEYQYEKELCRMIAESDRIPVGPDKYIAYCRNIRSNNLTVRAFARYLNRLLEKLAHQGFDIRLRPSERERATSETATPGTDR